MYEIEIAGSGGEKKRGKQNDRVRIGECLLGVRSGPNVMNIASVHGYQRCFRLCDDALMIAVQGR